MGKRLWSTKWLKAGASIGMVVVKATDPKSMPFDTKRMFWGGFTVFVDI
jgi:uncharacterized protein YbaA (DUF1428 family)